MAPVPSPRAALDERDQRRSIASHIRQGITQALEPVAAVHGVERQALNQLTAQVTEAVASAMGISNAPLAVSLGSLAAAGGGGG